MGVEAFLLERWWLDLIESSIENFLWLPLKKLRKSIGVSGDSYQPALPSSPPHSS